MSDGKLTLDDVSCDVENTPMPIKTIVAPLDSITLEVQKVLTANKSVYSAGSAASIFLTAVSVLVSTSEFKPLFNLPGAFWHGVFSVLAVASAACAVFFAYRAIKLRSALPAEKVVQALMARTKDKVVKPQELPSLERLSRLRRMKQPLIFR